MHHHLKCARTRHPPGCWPVEQPFDVRHFPRKGHRWTDTKPAQGSGASLAGREATWVLQGATSCTGRQSAMPRPIAEPANRISFLRHNLAECLVVVCSLADANLPSHSTSLQSRCDVARHWSGGLEPTRFRNAADTQVRPGPCGHLAQKRLPAPTPWWHFRWLPRRRWYRANRVSPSTGFQLGGTKQTLAQKCLKIPQHSTEDSPRVACACRT
mmetsp:Transcript_92822/g.266959  ORF Transcript_92822/g.266959 Transcript_92822/m.266959 type:complete len:213 (+) Transcript_92822:684-1322(+)